VNPARLFVPLLVLVAALLHAPASAAEKWLRADTHNFIIFSSGNRTQLQQFAENVERFDALLRQRNKIARDPEPNRLTIYLLAQPGDVARVIDDKKRMVAGFYSARPDGSFAVANRAKAISEYSLSGNTVLFHEYAHHFMYRYYTSPYPAWFVEGFAEFYSTTEFEPNGGWSIGRPAYHRAGGLLLAKPVPIESLLFGVASRKSIEQADAFYGRSWLLVHMLTMEVDRSGQLNAYLTAVAKGKPHREATLEAFGDLDKLNKALDTYLAKSRISILKSKQLIAVDGEIRISELDPVASQLTALSLKVRVEKDPAKTRDELQALAIKAPQNAEVWYELARAELQIGQKSEDAKVKTAASSLGELAIDRALALSPEHVRANVFKARLQFERLQDAKDDKPASWRAVRALLVKANAAAKLDPEPLVAWYDSFGAQGIEPTKNASDGLSLAFNLAPEASELRVRLAFDHARKGNFDRAIKLIEPLAYDPHDNTAGLALLAQIKAMRDSSEKPETTTAPPAKQP
jgi:hypothetical protein